MYKHFRNLIFTILLLLIVVGISFASSPPSNDNRMTPEHMQADLEQLKMSFIDRHPLIVTRFPKEYEDLFNQAQAQLTKPLTLPAFSVILSKTLAQIGDDHTQVEFLLEGPVLPFVLKVIDDQFYVLDGGSCIPEGSQILTIGDIPIQDIYTSYCELYSAENDYWRQVQFEQRYIEIGKIKELGGHFDLWGGLSVTYLPPVSSKTSKAQSLKIGKKSYIHKQYDCYNPLYSLYNDKYDGQCDENVYKYFVHEDKDYLYLVADWCYFYDGYEAILTEVFTILDEKSIRNIVIDLRGNPGGSSEIIDPFFEKVKRHNFHANNDSNPLTNDLQIFGLIDKRTFSSAVQFATEIYHDKHGTLVGQPTGGKLPSFGNIAEFELKYSGLRFSISDKFITYKGIITSESDTLMPDFQTVYTIDDYLNGIDKDLEAVESMIAS